MVPPQRKSSSEPADKAAAAPAEDSPGALAVIREWADALVIAFVLAMFVRVFIVELFKIPTGSMTPTLLGDEVAYVDWDNDGLEDLVVRGHQTLVFINKGGRYEVDPTARPSPWQIRQWEEQRLLRPQYDRILVNKFRYWFTPPQRGDVVVFKVPDVIWDPKKPIYIKRVVGVPGDVIEFDGRLRVGGEIVESPSFFNHQEYINSVPYNLSGFEKQPFVKYRKDDFSRLEIEEVDVPPGGIYVLGDNTRSSLDSRYWGLVSLDSVKGKAFMRYWPINRIKFID